MEGKKVALCATTGAAACRLSRTASIVHKIFAIPKSGRYLTPLASTHEVYIRLAQADVIVIDEMSMLTAALLDFVFYRLRQVCGTLQAAFASKLLLIVGDHAQLPAVCHHRLEADDPVCLRCHISRSVHWPVFSVHHVSGSMRHSDLEFLDFLNYIRVKVPSDALIQRILKHCFVSESSAMSQMTGTSLVLCSHRADAVRFNEFVLRKEFNETQILSLRRSSNALQVPQLQAWLSEWNFFELDFVAVGARVMLTSNLDTKKFAANGSLGTVTGVSSPGGNVKTIFVKIDEGGAEIGVRRTKFQTRHHDGRRFFKSAFPLLLGYAITGHKSQGSTIRSSVYVYVKEAFAPGLVYVMLSRVTDRSKLKIIDGLRSEDFLPVPNLLGFDCQ